MDPEEVDVNNIKYYDANGKEIKNGGTSGSSGGTGWLSGILGAIPGILSSLFPNGIGGGGNNYPTISTLPNGNTNVQMQGNSNILMYALILMVGFLVFTGMKPIQPQKKR